MGLGIRTKANEVKDRARRSITRVLFGGKGARQREFQRVYKNRMWGSGGGDEFFSGVGSRGEAVDAYSSNISSLLLQHQAELGRPLRIVDLGCGDFVVGQRLLSYLPQSIYVGCDIVPELVARNQKTFGGASITFQVLDMVNDPIPEGDVCLVREVFQHLSNAEILETLPKLAHRFVYVTEAQPKVLDGPINPDKAAGAHIRFDWRTGRGRGVELDQPPYNLKTREVFRTGSSSEQYIVTQQLLREPPAFAPERP
jgi:SAM-dependent methyltransferase